MGGWRVFYSNPATSFGTAADLRLGAVDETLCFGRVAATDWHWNILAALIVHRVCAAGPELGYPGAEVFTTGDPG